jgi:hypothetical protein
MVQYIEHVFQHVIRVKFIVVIGALAKRWLFWLCRRVGFCVGFLFTLTPNFLLPKQAIQPGVYPMLAGIPCKTALQFVLN